MLPAAPEMRLMVPAPVRLVAVLIPWLVVTVMLLIVEAP